MTQMADARLLLGGAPEKGPPVLLAGRTSAEPEPLVVALESVLPGVMVARMFREMRRRLNVG